MKEIWKEEKKCIMALGGMDAPICLWYMGDPK